MNIPKNDTYSACTYSAHFLIFRRMREREKLLNHIGISIKNARLKAGLTQDEVAFKAQLSRSYYSGVERGVRNVSSINLMRIATVIGEDVGHFFPKVQNI